MIFNLQSRIVIMVFMPEIKVAFYILELELNYLIKNGILYSREIYSSSDPCLTSEDHRHTAFSMSKWVY